MTHGLKRLSNRGWVMAKIVDHGDAPDAAADFLSALDAFKRGDGGLNGRERDAVEVGGANGHGGVADVEFSGDLEVEACFK